MLKDLALPYNHMGATITDAVLQAGLRYEMVVWPRVQHVMTIPAAATTSGFLAVLRERGGEEVVHWTHPVKLGRMEAVAELFIADRIETEADLRTWLCGDRAAGDGADAACSANITKLAAVHGIGPKTIDYFKILCGEQDTAAIDMHLTRFLEQAGVRVTSYEQARAVIAGATPTRSQWTCGRPASLRRTIISCASSSRRPTRSTCGSTSRCRAARCHPPEAVVILYGLWRAAYSTDDGPCRAPLDHHARRQSSRSRIRRQMTSRVRRSELSYPETAPGSGPREVAMLTAYITAALRMGHYELLPDDAGYFGTIQGLDGVWAQAASLEECRDQLQEVLEEWIILGLRMGHPIPVIDGIALTVQEVA